jgi:hypothetical protein
MSIGLGNLTELKSFLLPASLLMRTDFDSSLSLIGKGVAAGFDKYCNRKFQRGSGVTETFHADRDHWYVQRYPLETVTALALKYSDADGWETQDITDILSTEAESGRVWFGYYPGDYQTLARLTYTGGFWIDPGDGTTIPAGATAVPDEVKLAWLTQCQHMFGSRDNLGKTVAKENSKASPLADLDLVPSVKSCLESFVRYHIV